jgi:diguanylate cyclase (GGDEF)-like protein/PAS domain S-box-containing protein
MGTVNRGTVAPPSARINPVGGAALLASLPDPVVVVDAEGTILWASASAEEWLGWVAADIVGRSGLPLVHPDDVVTALASLASVQDKHVGTPVEIRVCHADGTYRHVEVRGRSAISDPAIGGVVLALRDLSGRRQWDVAGGDALRLQIILDHAPGITMLIGADGRLRGASRAFTTILGRDLESSLGRQLRDFVIPPDVTTVGDELRAATSEVGSRTFEATFTTRAGGFVPMSLTAANLLDDRTVRGLVVTAVDITTLAQTRAQLRHLATHDPLTNLANRALLHDRLAQAQARARRNGGLVAVVFCDLNGFKCINDAHGHGAGDAVLVEVGRRLRAIVREHDTIARVGGDEFGRVLEDADDAVAAAVARRIRARICEPVRIDSYAVRVGVSVGVAVDDGSVGPDELLTRADTAMYRTKRRVAGELAQ